MTQATTTPATPRQPAWRGDDFPSWLSPMVVKELRQGVQSGAFAWTFIGLQAAMFLFLSWGMTVIDPAVRGPGRDIFQFFFWLIVAVGVLFILPLRGLGTISSERTGNNLDLVRLTRLSATKIVFGKWLAIVAQGALLVAAILPYLVLRYFFGGVNVIRDLEIIGWLFAGSMVVAAAAIALSTQPLWVRIAAGASTTILGLVALAPLIDRGRIFMMGSSERIGLLAVLALYTVVLLEYSASRIAPVAENHALRKRSLALAIGGVWLFVGGWAAEQTAAWTMAVTLPLVIVYAIEALLEQPVHLKSQAAALARFGLPGRVVARLLLPGWPSGLVFVVVMMAMCLPAWWAFVARVASGQEASAASAVGPLLAAAVLFPLPAVVYFRRVKCRLLLYVLVQLLCFMAFAYTNAMKPHQMSWVSWRPGWLALLPLPTASLASLLASEFDAEVGIACFVASVVVAAVVCLAVLPPWLKEMRETGRGLAAARAVQDRHTAAARAGASA